MPQPVGKASMELRRVLCSIFWPSWWQLDCRVGRASRVRIEKGQTRLIWGSHFPPEAGKLIAKTGTWNFQEAINDILFGNGRKEIQLDLRISIIKSLDLEVI